jgi:hypothetical protein
VVAQFRRPRTYNPLQLDNTPTLSAFDNAKALLPLPEPLLPSTSYEPKPSINAIII